MKKDTKLFLGTCLAIGLAIVFIGCGSTPKSTGEPSPFEGEWILTSPHTTEANRMVQVKYTFSGKSFVMGSDAAPGNVSGNIQNLARGSFTYTPVMIRLETSHMGTPKGGWMKDSFKMAPTILYEYKFDNDGNLFITNESGTYPLIKQ